MIEKQNGKKVYTVNDIKEILGLSDNKAYLFISDCYKTQEKFRVLKIGREYKIPIESFNKWLYGE